MALGDNQRSGITASREDSMTSDDRLFAMVQLNSAIESQLVSCRSFLGAPDPKGARSYRELQEVRWEMDEALGYGTQPSVSAVS